MQRHGREKKQWRRRGVGKGGWSIARKMCECRDRATAAVHWKVLLASGNVERRGGAECLLLCGGNGGFDSGEPSRRRCVSKEVVVLDTGARSGFSAEAGRKWVKTDA
jgi:hypothetical protein